MAGVLERIGISAEAVRRSAARQHRKASSGRKGLPEFVVQAMYADYQMLGSLSKTAAIYNRTRQSMWQIFHAHGLAMQDMNLQPHFIFDGRHFSFKKGYYRETTGAREPLHQAMWRKFRGPIPAGHQVAFKDGDSTNLRVANLVCLPIAEVSLMHYRRRFPSRAELTPEQRREMWKTHNRLYARRRAKAWKKQGLRSDGKPRALNRSIKSGNRAWKLLSDRDPGLARLAS